MTENIDELIGNFIKKSISIGDLNPLDEVYTTNRLLELLNKENYEATESISKSLQTRLEILDQLVEYAVTHDVIEDLTATRDVLAAKVMDLVTLKPSQVNENFWNHYEKEPQLATDYFYEMSKRNNYIKTREITKNIEYDYKSEHYGELQITINLSKPEKDPKEIALAVSKKEENSYPANALVIENEGYSGHLTHPGRSNHRIIRLTLHDEIWGFQYSPYAYYNEHSIFLAAEHRPMSITGKTFSNLFEIIRQFPHYFAGSNADLPIVGGSILSQDHYQAGRHHFPIEDAPYLYTFQLDDDSEIEVGIIDWPMSTIRVRGNNIEQLVELGTKILKKWKNYTDESVEIIAHTGQKRHNTITPIVRQKNEQYEMDIVLRNNRTSEKYPDGIFHPHPKFQHIKKENIGLIEVMGLAILPGRLKNELYEVEKYLIGDNHNVDKKHERWAKELRNTKQPQKNIDAQLMIQNAVGEVFEKVLEHAGVFKNTKKGQSAFIRFIKTEVLEN